MGLHLAVSPVSEPAGGRSGGGFERLAAIAEVAEASGFDSIWVSDGPPGAIAPSTPGVPVFEAYTVLGALAVRTRRASLGALATPVTARNPAVLAKVVTTLDVLSGGRAVLGMGMGGAGDGGGTSAVVQTDAAGDDKGGSVHPRTAPRAGVERDRLAEGLQICRAMFTEAAPSFEGRYYRIEGADNRPRPVRAGGVPILVDGNGDDRVLGLAARHGDAVTLRGDLETVRRALAVLDRHCDEAGRERASVSRIGVATMVIGPTGDEAPDRVARRSGPGQRPPAYRGPTVARAPDTVDGQVAALRTAGADGVVLTLANVHEPDLELELEVVELTGARLRRLFA